MNTGVTPQPTPTTAGQLARAALLPAAVTVAVFVPEFFRDPSQVESSWGITLVWLVALLVAAPVTAYLINRRRAVATTVGRAALVGLPQLPLVVLLMVVDVWFDVRSGYLLAGSGEEAMSYGIGSVVASVFGAILLVLVAVTARLGARRRPRAPV